MSEMNADTKSTAATLTANHPFVGATVLRVYYAVPDHYTIGETFDDLESAVSYAREKIAKIKTGAHGEFTKPQATLDTRMVIGLPKGGSNDFVYERTTITN